MIPVDLLVVGGLTLDQLASGRLAAGGAARYATEAALADGRSVALLTAAGLEPEVRGWLASLGEAVPTTVRAVPTSIRFEHTGSADDRRLRLLAAVSPLTASDAPGLVRARAVLFGPVAGDIAPALVAAAPSDSVRVAGIQGWLRRSDADGWVDVHPLGELPSDLATVMRSLDLLVASERDIGHELLAPQALAILRAWSGPGPDLVITAGAAGAWAQSADGPLTHIQATRLADTVPTVGAGDAFAAILAAHRGAGQSLAAAVAAANAATARWLAIRPAP